MQEKKLTKNILALITKAVVTFGFPLFILSGIIIAIWTFAFGNLEAALTWYSFTQPDGAIITNLDIFKTFLATVLFCALGFNLLTLIITFGYKIGSVSAGQVYVTFIKAMTISTTIAIYIIATQLLQISLIIKLLLMVSPLIVIVIIIFLLLTLKNQQINGFKKDLFHFYMMFSLKKIDIFDDKNSNINIISLILPLILTISGLMAVSILLQFSFIIAKNIIIFLSKLLSFSLNNPLNEISNILNFASVTLILLCIFVFFLSSKIYRKVSTHVRLTVINVAHSLLFKMFRYSFLIIAIFTLLTITISEQYNFIIIGYSISALLLLLFIATFIIYNINATSELLYLHKQNKLSRLFWINCKKILSSFPQPDKSKGYVFLHTQTDTYTIASILLVLCRLRQTGWSTIILDNWPISTDRTQQGFVDRFFDYKFGEQRMLNFDWNIDWKNKKVEAAGMNFYHPIWEGLSRHFGRYTVTIEKGSEAEEVFRDILQVVDSTLLVDFRIFNTVAGNGKPVRIAGGSGQFAPNAVHNIFCREKGKDRDMHFVWLQQGYQTYYADNEKLSKKISIQNMTSKWPYSNPYLPHVDDFNAWVKKGQDVKAIMHEAKAWANTNRATEQKNMTFEAKNALNRIKEHRENNGTVVCVLGKMVFDLSTPFEKGPAHDGMYDWLNHTVNSVRGKDDVLLVIKPHPYEIRPELAGVVEQYFTDMIETGIPDNVIILAHNWFNLHALTPHIDLGIMWNGTSGLEFGLQNIPMLMCSHWGPIDYNVGFPAPKDRKDYERILSDPKSVKIGKDFDQKCALMLKYTSTDEVMIPYDYCARPLTNERFGIPYWNMKQVNEFIKNGDPHINVAADRFK